MKLEPKTSIPPIITQEILADPILTFISEHREGLWYAAHYLGGNEAARLIERCAEILAQDQCVTPRTRFMIDQILKMLCVDQFNDRELTYTGNPVAIDPFDPVVEEISLLADALRHALGFTDDEPHTTGP